MRRSPHGTGAGFTAATEPDGGSGAEERPFATEPPGARAPGSARREPPDAPRALAQLVPFVLILLPAVVAAQWTVRDLTWPYDLDFNRSIAQAQVFADGRWGEESFYRGESVWYPPLVPALVAFVSQATGLSVPMLFVRLGPVLNLLGPIGLYVAVRQLFGTTAAVLAVFDYLYLRPPWIPAWAAGTYSPWLFSTSFAQGLFLLGFASYQRASSSGRAVWFAVTGAFAGLAFLCHNAPCLILALVVAVGLVDACVRRAPPRPTLVHHGLLAATAFLVALPNLAVIVGRYQLRFLNDTPARWVWSAMSDSTQWSSLFGPSAAIGLAGLVVAVARGAARGAGLRLFLFWSLINAGLLIGLTRAPLLPPHHMLAYLQIAASVAVGMTLACVLEACGWDRVARAWRPRLAVAAALAAVAAVWPSYQARRDLWQGRRLSAAEAARPNQMPAYRWLREHTVVSDVILANEDLSFRVAGPAGRGVLVVPALWASPFVDDQRRRRDRDRMLDAARAGDDRAFCAIARWYGVTHVLWTRDELPEGPASPRFVPLYARGRIHVHAAPNCPR